MVLTKIPMHLTSEKITLLPGKPEEVMDILGRDTRKWLTKLSMISVEEEQRSCLREH